MTRSEAELLDAVRAGQRDALEELLERHEPQIYRFGLRMCGTEDAAREVLQQTLLTAFRGLRSFRGDAALSTWLYQIARSFCIKSRRRRVDEPEETRSGPETIGDIASSIACAPSTIRSVVEALVCVTHSIADAADTIGTVTPKSIVFVRSRQNPVKAIADKAYHKTN